MRHMLDLWCIYKYIFDDFFCFVLGLNKQSHFELFKSLTGSSDWEKDPQRR